MAEARRKLDREFKEGAVRVSGRPGRPIPRVWTGSRGINEGTLGNC